MNCPNCGNEVQPTEKFCRSCGSQLPENAANTAQTAAVPADPTMSFKAFVESPYCTPDVNKNIKGSWITLFVCAGLSLIVSLAGKLPPIDAILIAGIAVWLMLTKSVAAGVTAGVVGVLELVLTSIAMGKLAGYLPAIAGVYATVSVLKGSKQFKAFKANGFVPTNTQ